MNKSILAVDPGLSGGWAWTFGEKEEMTPYVDGMPETEGDILAMVKDIIQSSKGLGLELCAYVELVPIGMPGKGAAMAKLNANAAFIRGCLMALGVRMILIRPAEWQAFYNLGKRSGCKSDSDWKGKLKAEAQRRFPGLKVTLKTADAILLLEYALSTKENQ